MNCSQVILTPTILGEGSNARVYEGLSQGDRVAVKVMDKKNFSPVRKEELQSEISVLRAISGKHENICSLLAHSEEDNIVKLVFEYYPQTIFEVCNDLGFLYEQEAKEIFRQLVDAVAFLHNYKTAQYDGICHRDLKLENIMISEDNTKIALIDFGFATFVKPGEKLNKKCGSFHYVAPEIIKGEEYDGKRVDIWALGCILYTLLMGKQPFDAGDTTSLFKKIVNGKYEDLPSHFGMEIRNLIRKMLQVDPRKRFDINQIKSHPWLKIKS